MVKPPKVRKTVCAKCPFGPNLTPGEQQQAEALKQRLASQPTTVWGCHETVRGRAPTVCAGFAAWKQNKEPVE